MAKRIDADTPSSVPELDWILESLGKVGAYPTQKTTSAICSAYAEVRGDLNQAGAFFALTRALNALPAIVAELPEGGLRATGQNAIRPLYDIFDPEKLGQDARDFHNRIGADLKTLHDMVPIFQVLGESTTTPLNTVDLFQEIEKLKVVVGGADSLSDPSKTVIFGQLELLARSVHRYASSGVGPFRDSVFTIYGRIRMHLDADTNATDVDETAIVDQFLRLYGVVDAAVNIGKLGAPVVMKLLEHHAR